MNTEKQSTVQRPWGTYRILDEGDGYLIKTITVNSGQRLSIQRHFHRIEHWVVLEGTATVLKNDKEFLLNAGETTDIDIKEIHSLKNSTPENLKILEIQRGDLIDENDIERLSDIYGRK